MKRRKMNQEYVIEDQTDERVRNAIVVTSAPGKAKVERREVNELTSHTLLDIDAEL